MNIDMNIYILNCVVILAVFIYFNWKDGEDLQLSTLIAMFLVACIPVLNWIVLVYLAGRELFRNHDIDGIVILKGRK